MAPRLARARLTTAVVAAVTAALATPVPSTAAPAGSPDTVEVTGTLVVLAGEDGTPDRYSVLLPSGRSVALSGAVDAEPLSRFTGTLAVPGTSGDRQLTGAPRASALRRASTAGTPMRVLEARTSERAPAPGPSAHTTYVAKITNFGTIGLTDQQVLDTITGSQAYWVRESGGLVPSFTTVTGVAAVAAGAGSAAGGCGLGNGGADFDAIAQNVAAQAYPGVDFSGASPNHLVIMVPDGCGGGTTGRARLGTSFANGGPAIVAAQTPAETLSTLNHEWGHNLGLQHANNIRAEYGDLYEVMGADDGTARTPVLGTVYRWEQGIIGAGEVVDGSGGGAWTLAPRSSNAGLRSVVFIDPDTGKRHFVDLRNGSGDDAGTCYASGACNYTTAYGQTYAGGVTIERENDSSGAFLLPVPGNDGVLTGGETWTNAGGTLSVSANGGSVTVGRNTNVPTVAGGTAVMTSPTALRDVSASGTGFSPAPAGYRYQWLLDGQPIANAEDSTFRPTPAMAGRQLSVTVTAYAVGHNPVARTSTPQQVAAAQWYALPTRKLPEITGKKRVGSVLSVVGLDWVDYYGNRPADLAPVYTWTRNGKKIKGATKATYRLTVRDRGKRIQVTERPRAAGFATDDKARSNATGKVRIGKLASPRPKVGGKAKVGKRLVARTPGWTRGTKFRYQWFSGKRAIRGAHGKKLKVTRALRGDKVSVRVTGSKKGFKPASARSRAVKIKK
ncbi:hypothetical protein [Nocardioides zeicaulis]|uniref:Peptidase M11 gametolysin domain-containing protein n=1 Tax=Nocardioides zeicaulis TaxID=1776857 RepID=A0ABV6DW93_9ACTN